MVSTCRRLVHDRSLIRSRPTSAVRRYLQEAHRLIERRRAPGVPMGDTRPEHSTLHRGGTATMPSPDFALASVRYCRGNPRSSSSSSFPRRARLARREKAGRRPWRGRRPALATHRLREESILSTPTAELDNTSLWIVSTTGAAPLPKTALGSIANEGRRVVTPPRAASRAWGMWRPVRPQRRT